MYRELSPETAEFIDFMMEYDLFDVLGRKTKRQGGYMTFMDDEVVFPQVIETRYDKNRLEYISSSCEYIKDNP